MKNYKLCVVLCRSSKSCNVYYSFEFCVCSFCCHQSFSFTKGRISFTLFCSIVAPCRLISLLFFTIYLVNLSLKHLSMFTKRVTNGMCEWYIVQSSNQRNHFSYTCTNTFEDAGLFLKRCKILGYYYTICSISDLCTKSCHYSLKYLLCQKTYELSYASVNWYWAIEFMNL